MPAVPSGAVRAAYSGTAASAGYRVPRSQ